MGQDLRHASPLVSTWRVCAIKALANDPSLADSHHSPVWPVAQDTSTKHRPIRRFILERAQPPSFSQCMQLNLPLQIALLASPRAGLNTMRLTTLGYYTEISGRQQVIKFGQSGR